MSKEQSAFAAMLTAVALYSLFPLFNAFSVGVITPLVYVFKACVVAVMIDTFLIIVNRVQNKTASPISFKNVRLHYLAGAAFLATISYCILVYAFSIGSNAGVTMLYELWPLIVFFFLPVAFRDRFLRLSLFESVAALIAVFGLGLIVFSAPTDSDKSWVNFFGSGEILGLTAGVLMSFAVLLKSKSIVGRDIGELEFSDFLIIDLVNRGMAAIYAFLGIILIVPSHISEIIQWDSSFGFGVIEGLGGLLYWIAVARSQRSSLQLLLYLAPVLGFVWLYFMGLAELSGAILFGSILIFSSNVIAHFRGEQTFAFFLAVSASVIFGAISYLSDGQGEGDGYVQVTVSMTLYAILIGFLLNRLAERNFRQREACKKAFDEIAESYPDMLKDKIIYFLRDSFRKSSVKITREYEDIIRDTLIDRDMRHKLATVALLRINPVSAGEMLSIIFVGFVVIASGYFTRPDSFFGDFFVFIVGIVIVYLTTTVIEQKDIRLGEGRVMRIAIGINDSNEDPAFDFVVGGISLVIGIIILVSISLALKHQLL